MVKKNQKESQDFNSREEFNREPVEEDHDEEEDEEDEDEETELDRMVGQLGPCAAVYWDMDRCLDANNHQWKGCQPEVKALRECFEKNAGSQSPAVQRQRMAQVMASMAASSRKKKQQKESVRHQQHHHNDSDR